DATLLRGTRVEGRVVDPEDRPIAGAEVTCTPRWAALLAPTRQAHALRSQRTDAEGRFAFEGIPGGEYQLLAFHDGYRVALQGTPSYPDGRSDLRDVEVVLRPVASGDRVVEGRVVSRGVPVARARVSLAALDLGALGAGGQEAVSDDAGAFRFRGVWEG